MQPKDRQGFRDPGSEVSERAAKIFFAGLKKIVAAGVNPDVCRAS
jgi:hypothetical protein